MQNNKFYINYINNDKYIFYLTTTYKISANAVSSALLSDYEWNLTLHVLSKPRNQSVFMDSRKHVQSNQRQQDLLIQSCVLRLVSRMIWFLW